MGVACPHLSNDPCYTMVDSSVTGSGPISGSCRCACQLHDEPFSSDADGGSPAGCCRCSPHMFTSVLLGVLACVLMTGGVFLAFHRWDPLWLIVSAVGVVLVLIGSLLHCCAAAADNGNRARNGAAKGVGCCGRPPNDHLHGHLPNNGSLTEQLLPLSNARSVSQLSLNMLPGYFPPVVTTYGIEQHSAVVQNINRLVQQNQLQQAHLTGVPSPAAAANGGKSFILLSLPGDTSATNLQNLVATVYQLDGSVETPTTDITSPATTQSNDVSSTPSPSVPVVKNVEVQTCNLWPSSAPSGARAISSQPLTSSASTSTCNIAIEPSIPNSSNSVSCTAQTEDFSDVPPPESINLMDCSPEIPIPVCDNLQVSGDSLQVSDLVSIPLSTSAVLVDVSEHSVHPVTSNTATNVTESLLDSAAPVVDVLIEVEVNENSVTNNAPSEVLVEIEGASSGPTGNADSSGSELPGVVAESTMTSSALRSAQATSSALRSAQATSSALRSAQATSSETSSALLDDPLEGPSTRTDGVLVDCDQLLAVNDSYSNLSELDAEVDDDEIMRSSSPPPSYDDVTLESENAIGAFGLAYGTI